MKVQEIHNGLKHLIADITQSETEYLVGDIRVDIFNKQTGTIMEIETNPITTKIKDRIKKLNYPTIFVVPFDTRITNYPRDTTYLTYNFIPKKQPISREYPISCLRCGHKYTEIITLMCKNCKSKTFRLRLTKEDK